MNRYTLVDIIEEKNPLHASNPTLEPVLYVAIIKDSEQEAPFRLVVENFADPVEARKEIDAWIAEREREDAAREGEKLVQAEGAERAEKFTKLKTTLLN